MTETASRGAPPGLSASPDRDKALTPAELMQRLQVSENVIYRELQYGFLSSIAFRIGRQWRVSEAALEALIGQRSVGRDQTP